MFHIQIEQVMTLFSQLIHGGTEGQPSLDEALADLVISGYERGSKRRRARSSGFTRTPPVAFGGLFDLMRFRTRDARRDEICEECKTLNRCDACFCKTCMHKLPAYYTSADPQLPLVIWRRRARENCRSSVWDLVAVVIVLISLVLMTANIPGG